MNDAQILYETASGHYRDGRLDVAEPLYRAVLALDPSCIDALRDLASIAESRGDPGGGVHLLERALVVAPRDQACLISLVELLLRQGRRREAESTFGRLCASGCDDGVLAGLRERFGIRDVAACDTGGETEGVTLDDTARAPVRQVRELTGLVEDNRLEEALSKARLLCKKYPRDFFLWKAMGTVLYRSDDCRSALPAMQQALALNPKDPELLNTLGNILHDLGRLAQSQSCFSRAIALSPDYAEAHNSLGAVLKSLGRFDEAIASYRRALALKPDLSEAYSNIGIVYKDTGELDKARRYYEMALDKDPDNLNARNNLGGVLQDLGRHDEAIRCYSAAIQGRPEFAVAESNRLFTINYHPDRSAEEVYAAYRDYDRRHGEAARAHWRAHTNTRDAERRLRLGYVSPDFRSHAIRYMLEPLLEHHDRTRFELHAYAELTREDAQTARYRSLVDHWVPTRGLNDGELAARIRADGIDILVDLAGHTAGNRLGVFARKPAPVSVSAWVGYGYTTGLSAIDYFLADEVLVPEGSEGLFGERPWRLAAPGGVYRPSAGMGAVNALPALERGAVTFGTLTRGVRINHRTVRVWSEILDRVPGSRLVVNSKDFVSDAAQQALAERFAAHGIARERLEIGYHSPPWDVLRGMDIGLDCFPHNSGTTLMESLYMGVPFVTLADRPSVGRIGATILAGIGRDAWIAPDEAGYVERAVALAADLAGLAAIRAGLRGEMEASAWRDEPGGIARIEAAYRAMWRRWCERRACLGDMP
ncbi:hypothetical protein MARPU_09165 [Marichromatium purpuratum 984]|uniref:protein O-GlcNAc transferase n=1 Tax=Marichromatium purpuratum 984 TaxID=765910 RepID=W0E3A9_MARPU|nr:tetratricopeptide repeat protein [Marichromatium purpuratum]AHF04018.1 hypothetical protein MARPU_09165 [Marichromatium purpuratum 984]